MGFIYKVMARVLFKEGNKEFQCGICQRNSGVVLVTCINMYLFPKFKNKTKSIKINLGHAGDLGSLLSPILGQYNIKPVEFLSELNKNDKFIGFGLEGMVLPIFCKIYVKTGKYDLFVRPCIVFLFIICFYSIRQKGVSISFFI